MNKEYNGTVYRRCYGTPWTYCKSLGKSGRYNFRQNQCKTCCDFLKDTDHYIRDQIAIRKDASIAQIMARNTSVNIIYAQDWSCADGEDEFIYHFASLLMNLSKIKVKKLNELVSLLSYVPYGDLYVSETNDDLEIRFDENGNEIYVYKEKEAGNEQLEIDYRNHKGQLFYESIDNVIYLEAAFYAYNIIFKSEEYHIIPNLTDKFRNEIILCNQFIMEANDFNALEDLTIIHNDNDEEVNMLGCHNIVGATVIDYQKISTIAIDHNNVCADDEVVNMHDDDVGIIIDDDDNNVVDMSITSSSYPTSDSLSAARLTLLTTEEVIKVNNFVQGPANDKHVIFKFNINITREKIICLRPATWLNDEIINFCMEMLTERDARLIELHPSSGRIKSHYFNTFFMEKLLGQGHRKYNYCDVARWTKRFNIFNRDKIFIPINITQRHWMIAVVFMQLKEIRYYDSGSGTRANKYLNALMKWVIDEAKFKYAKDVHRSEWKLIYERNCPKQRNGFDCGMFTIMCADYLTDNLELLEDPRGPARMQESMPHFRQKIALDILRGSFNYPF